VNDHFPVLDYKGMGRQWKKGQKNSKKIMKRSTIKPLPVVVVGGRTTKKK